MFPVMASQLPQASFIISGRAASLQNKIKLNSLRRKENKSHSFPPKGGVWESLQAQREQSSAIPAGRDFSSSERSASSLLVLLAVCVLFGLSSWLRWATQRPPSLTLAHPVLASSH